MIKLPMRATDWDPDKIQFHPEQGLGMLPKIDGVRALNIGGQLYARTLKRHDNKYTTDFYSIPEFTGFDGEMVAEAVTHPRLVSLTTSAMSTISGQPFTLWWLFDYLTHETLGMGYQARHHALIQRVLELKKSGLPQAQHLRVVPLAIARDIAFVMEMHSSWCKDGYEGSILRKLDGMHKDGTSTVKEGGYLRIKSFADCEGFVVDILEGQKNGNEATVNELGRTSRSTHKANMTSNGMVGTFVVRLLDDVVVNNGTKTVPKGTVLNVSAGRFDHEQRQHLWNTPDAAIGQILKFQHFPTGVKDVLRFPTAITFRSPHDVMGL